MANIDIKAVRRDIGKMFKRVKGREARGKAMRRIWQKHKRK